MKKILCLLATLLVAVLGILSIFKLNVNAEESKTIVYAQVPDDWSEPCLWAWDADGNSAFAAWPGKAMLADENNEGWYYLYVDSTMSNVIVNANEGSVQTADMSTDGKDAWVTVESAQEATIVNDKLTENEAPEYVEEEVTSEEATTPDFSDAEMITVHAKAPSDWLLPSLWAWSAPDGTNVFANWPGQELELNGDWYEYQVPNWVNSIIINGNLGEVQTTDISIETGKDVWVVVNGPEDFEVSYEAPQADAALEDLAETETAETEVDETESNNSNTGLVVAIIAAIVVLGAVVGVIVYNKSKKSA